MDKGFVQYFDCPNRTLATRAPDLIFCWPFLEFDQLLSNIRGGLNQLNILADFSPGKVIKQPSTQQHQGRVATRAP
jgi:hypothetical protein